MLVDPKSGELFLYGPIGADFFGEGISADLFIEALDSLGGKRAKLRINSVGGSVFEGIAIYNAAKRYAGGVDVVIDSLAASIASIIALAGETRTSSKGSMWMIHRAMTFTFGNQEELQKALNMLETGDKTLVGIYSDAMSKSVDEIEALMSAETWFTAEEALEVGLATAIEGKSKKPPQAAAWFRHAPQALYQQAAIASEVRPNVPIYRKVSALR